MHLNYYLFLQCYSLFLGQGASEDGVGLGTLWEVLFLMGKNMVLLGQILRMDI